MPIQTIPACERGIVYSHSPSGGATPSKKERVTSKFLGVLQENLGVNPEQVTLPTTIMGDLGADSLDVVELVMDVEEKFEITIPDEDESHFSGTVGKAVDYLLKHTPN